MKFLILFLFIAQVAFAAAKLQNSDFMSAAQLQAAGGTAAQLLNDTKLWSPELLEQQSNSLLTGSMHSVLAPDLMSEFLTPSNPPALEHKLYFKADGNLYMLNSAGTEAQVNGGSAPSGTPNTFAGFDGAGALYTIPNWGITSENGVAANHTQTATPATLSKLYTFESEINPAVPTTDYSALPFVVDAHFDRTGSGNNLDQNIRTVNISSSHEGSGNVGGWDVFNVTSNFGNGVGGSLGNDTVYSTATNYAAGFSMPGQHNDFISNVQVDAAASVNNVSHFSVSESGNISGNYQGFFINQSGNTGNFTGINIAQASGNSGNIEGARFTFSNGTSTSKTAVTAVMGDGASTGSGRIFDSSWGSGSYDNRIGFNINGGNGNITTSETMFNGSQSSGTSTSFSGLNINANGTTNNWVGVNVSGVATANTSVKGLDIDLSNISSTTQKIGLATNEGMISANSLYSTASYGGTPFFGNLHSIGGTLTVDAGTPLVGSAFLGANLGSVLNFNDNMSADPFGGLLGYTNVGYFSTLRVAAGKNVDRINGALAAFSNDAGSGTVGAIDGFVSAGLISAGGTVTGITATAFHALDGMCNQILGNCFSLQSQDNDAHLFNAGRAVFGGSYALPNEEILVNGSARVTESVYFQETAGGIDAVVMQAPAALTASYTMKLPTDMGAPGQVLTTDGVNQTSWSTPSSSGSSEIFTLDGGVTFDNDINGLRRAESNETIQKIVVCLSNSGLSGNTTVRINYGPALASNTTVSVAATNGPSCNSTTPAISLNTNDLINVDVIGVANGVPNNLSVKLYF